MKTTREVLRAAARHVETYGLHAGDFADYEEIARGAAEGVRVDPAQVAVCAWGAINVAAAGCPDRVSEAGDRAAAALADHLGISIRGIGLWSDAHGRTAGDVVAALRACAGGVAV